MRQKKSAAADGCPQTQEAEKECLLIMTKGRRLYVLSVDSMMTEDLAFMRTLPAFGRVLQNAAVVSNIISVYPTLTYTIHATMMTGVYPDRHHIVNNETFLPGQEKTPWYRSRKHFDPDVRSILEEAKRAGYTTAAICWPVTADMDVDWHLPETWSRQEGNQAMYQEFVRCGAQPSFLDEFWPEYGRSLTGLGEPYFSLVTHGAALAAIRRHKAEVIFEHLSMVDHTRHSYGVYGKQVYRNAYLEAEMMLSETLGALEAAGVLEDTTIVITSDHGQTPVRKLVAPNLFLARDGFISASPDGQISSWRAVFHSAAHSAQVYLSDPGDEALKKEVYGLLCSYRDSGEAGIAQIFTKEEAKERYHLEGDFSFVVEGEADCSFANRVSGAAVVQADNSDYKYSIATHGHLPETGPKPAMVLSGPGIRAGARVDGVSIVDEAPTLATLLGISLGEPDGKPIREVLDI